MKNTLASLVLLLFSASACAELEVVQLHHRSAEEILPVIRPLLDRDDVASGMNYQLILRASPRNIEQIKEMLVSIDIAPRRLKITVMQNVDSETVARLTEVSGNIGLGGGARICMPDSGDNGGPNVEIGQGQDRLKARVASTHSLKEERNTQQLQVLEGNRALVSSGQSVPVTQRQVIQDRWSTRVIDSMEYQEVSSGFYVLPRISGDRVTLEISAQSSALAPGGGYQPTARVQQASSTVSGRLGEWLEVGGSGQQQDHDDATISTRGASGTREQRSLLIRVEEVE